MNIRRMSRRAANTKCRTCTSELNDAFAVSVRHLDRFRSRDQIISLQTTYQETVRRRHAENQDNLFGINVRCASGGALEVICRHHLEQCVEAIIETLRD